MSADPVEISILHVDDQPEFTELTAEFLQREHQQFDIQTATSAEEGLRRLQTTNFDCVISDYDMPVTNGIEFLQDVRAEYPDLPFILFTGKGSETVASDAISAGVTDYLQKDSGPDQFELLANRITNAVEQVRTSQKLHEERQRFQILFDRLSQPIVEAEFINGEPIIRQVNAAFEDLFGYDGEEIKGASVDKYLVPDDKHAEADRINRKVRSGDSIDSEVVTRQTADGTRRFLLQSAVYDDCSSAFVVYTDITDERERQEKLRRSRDLLRQTEKLAGVGGWEADLETEELRWTEETYAIYGVDPDSFDPSVESGIDFYHPEDRETIEKAVNQCAENGEPYDEELRLITENGDQRWVHTTGEPVFDGDKIVKICGAIQDITERKQREKDLRRYEYLLKSSPDLLVLLNEEMTVEYQSPPSPLFDWEPREITGKNPLEFIHPDDHDVVIEHFTAMVEHPEEISTLEFRTQDATGEWRWIESRAQNCINEESISGILTVMREITDRKRQQQQLKQYSETLEQLQVTTRKLLETTDAEHAAEQVIESLERVLEYDIAGIWMRNEAGTELEPTVISERSTALVPDIPTYTAEASSLSWEAYANQEFRYVRDMATNKQRFNPDTAISSEVIVPLGEHGILNIGATETDAFSAQDRNLIRLWGETLTVILERITQLELLHEREEALVRERDRLDEFISVISHDLRNPLNVATLRTELAMQECDSDHLVQVETALTRMTTLIENLLQLARQGNAIGETEVVDLEEIANQCWQTVATSDATLTIERTANLRADANRLAQALENLFRNSVEHGSTSNRTQSDDSVEHGSTSPHSHAGEDAVENGSTSVDIRIGITEDESGFYVADNGPGIPADKRSQLFESTVNSPADGTGFGLSIVNQICQAHGWDVTVVESDSGGAQFEIRGVEFVD